jgi:hypothetical protein
MIFIILWNKGQATADGVSRVIIDGPENLVRIPRMKHYEINECSTISRPRSAKDSRSAQVMVQVGLKDMSVAELVEKFVSIALGQFQAERHDEFGKYNRLYKEMIAVEQELKSRPSDQRKALITLLEHSNPQVRLMAAKATLALAPIAARQTLQDILDRKQFRKQPMLWERCGRWSVATESPPNNCLLSVTPVKSDSLSCHQAAAWIHDHVTVERANVLAGQPAAGIAVMYEPVIAVDVVHKHHHVMIAHSHHSRSRRSPREFSEPVRSQIELGTDAAE